MGILLAHISAFEARFVAALKAKLRSSVEAPGK